MHLSRTNSVTLLVLVLLSLAISAEKALTTTQNSRTSTDSSRLNGSSSEDTDLIVLPNPVYDHNENATLIFRTRSIGTVLVTIYDAVGSTVFETTVTIQVPNAVGHKIAIPWDCRNQAGRFVGKGTYLAVVRVVDPENRSVARHTAKIGVAF